MCRLTANKKPPGDNSEQALFLEFNWVVGNEVFKS